MGLAARFGEGAQTYVHPVIACLMLVVVVLVLCLPRRWVIVPFLAAAFLIPLDQMIVLGPLHFQMLRVLILFGWIRLLATKTRSNLTIVHANWNVVDVALVLWASLAAIDIVLLWRSTDAVINQAGVLYTIFGLYFLLRFLIRDIDDVQRATVALVWVVGTVALIMLAEQATGRELYSIFGGVRHADADLWLRGGRFRSTAAFSNAIIAGLFGAITMPLFAALWSRGRRTLSAIGITGSTIVVITSFSSTPVLAYAAGMAGLLLWPMRDRMRLLRWGVVIVLVGLHLAMKAPVWALIQRMDVIGGSSGYHRYVLVDACIRHFFDWFLMGTKSNGQWGFLTSDVANQYVWIGESSGILPLAAFMCLIVYGFKYLGRARRAQVADSNQRFFWAVGCALFANAVGFFGIAYFDQLMVAWYLLLSIISATAIPSFVPACQQNLPAEESDKFQPIWAEPVGMPWGSSSLDPVTPATEQLSW